MRKAFAYLMIPIQILLMGIGVVFMLIQQIPQLWTRHVYYGWVQLRRRVAGEEIWQEHDTRLGVYPPRDHPFWKKVPSIVVNASDDEPPYAA